ncbi:DUF3566 domain-containing protein [Aeromicrobium sp. CTD01-1L150]|uniref:DUF3566 domain-containing protein n=1 Tax=Aeromicrobium sp. CTD01-1L150 TaxID=3341830 RepID=UPI0035C043E9
MSSTNPQKPTGSSAGDPERTQQIPRVEKSSSSKSSSSKSSPSTSRPAGTGASPASRSVAGSATKTDTAAKAPAKKAQNNKKAPAKKAAAPGEPRTVGEKLAADAAKKASASSAGSGTKAPAKKPAPADKKSTAPAQDPAQDPAKSKNASAKEGVAPERESARTPGSPMTARDYARTTRDSADSTSVIPAVAAPSSSAVSQTEHVSGRRAKLRLVHIDPWSVTKLSFVVSVALMLVAVVAVFIFWIVLDLAGVWDSLNGTITNVLSDGEAGFDLTDYLGLGRLVGLTLVLSAINVIVMTMIATIAAHLYNLFAQLLGGVDVTFTDK